MSKLLLGSLVAAMLALTGLVAYNTYTAPCPKCAAPPSDGGAWPDTMSCSEIKAPPCCTDPAKSDILANTAAETCPAAPVGGAKKND